MAIPHIIQSQIIEKRLKNKEGRTKINEIKKILEELPKWASGPYADIRKKLEEKITQTKTRAQIKHQDWIGVKKQGNKQFVLVGIPSAGKSSLLKELSSMDVKIADYEFTTLKPCPAIIKINQADIQIVDLPGLIKGASEDKGGGKRLLGIIKQADGIILMHDLTKPISATEEILQEIRKAGVQTKPIIIGNKADLAPAEELKKHFNNETIIEMSIKNKAGIEQLKQAIWEKSNLIRIKTTEEKPIILEKGATVKELAEKIHKDLAKNFKYAIINGPSAKFPNQQAGMEHQLEDGDTAIIKTKRL